LLAQGSGIKSGQLVEEASVDAVLFAPRSTYARLWTLVGSFTRVHALSAAAE
jgi:hypothetical protein